MDCKGFRFRAEVDFISIRFSLERSTRFDAVQRLLEPTLGYRPRIVRIEKGDAGETTLFVVEIQDPRNWALVGRVIDQMAKRYTFASAPKVAAIEIALDAYHEANDPGELAAMVARMYRGCTKPVSGNHRIYRHDKRDKLSKVYKPQAVPEPALLVPKLIDGWQIGIGNQTDDLYQHGYVKTTDDAGKIKLAPNQHRARFEIRLQGAEVEALEFPEFATLIPGNFFKFRIEDEAVTSLDPFRKVALSKLPQIGERKQRLVSSGKGVLYRRSVKADAVLNEKARWAFKNLAKRWNGHPKASPPSTSLRTSDASSDCRNSGSEDSVSQERFPSVEGVQDGARSNNYICPYKTHHRSTQATHQDNHAGISMPQHDLSTDDESTELKKAACENSPRTNDSAQPFKRTTQADE